MVAGHEQSSVPVEALRRSVDAGFGAALTDLGRLVAIPGIAWPGYDPAELERSTEVVAELLAGTGLPEVRIIRCATEDGAPGDPAVIARRAAAPGRRTVLLYAHHDVQPAAPPRSTGSPPRSPPPSGAGGSALAEPPTTRPGSCFTSPPFGPPTSSRAMAWASPS